MGLGNVSIVAILTIEREMIKYICGNVSGIDPANPVVQEICNNTCNLIGLGVNLTNTRTVPVSFGDVTEKISFI